MEKLVRYPTDQQIVDSQYTTRRAYLEAFRLQEKAAKIQAQRDKDLAELRAGGFTERSGARFMTVSEQTTTVYTGGVEKSLIPIVSPIQMEKARVAYRAYHAEKDQKKRQQFGADFGNNLGFDRSTARDAYALMHSEEAKRVFAQI